MSSSSRFDARSSLARATLLKMGMRIAVVIALSTLFSYLHLVKTLRDQALVQLREAVAERTQRELGFESSSALARLLPPLHGRAA